MPWHGKKNSRRAVTLAPSPGRRQTAEDGAFARGLTYLRDRWLRRRAVERRQHHNVAFEEELPPSCLAQIRDWFSKKTQQVADSRILCCLQRRKQWRTKVHPFQEPSQNPGSSVDKRPRTTMETVAGPCKAEVKPAVVNLGTGPIIHESPSPDVVILNDDLDIVSVGSGEADVDSKEERKEIPPKEFLVPIKSSSKIPTYPFGPSNSPGTSVDGPEFGGNIAGASVHAPVTRRNVDGTSVDPPLIGDSAIETSVHAPGTNTIVVSTSRYGDGPSTSTNIGAPSQGENTAEQRLIISNVASATGDAPSTSAEVAVNDSSVSQAITRIGEVMSTSEMFQRRQDWHMKNPDRFLAGLNSPRRLTSTPTRNTESPDSVERMMRRCVYATIEMAMDIAIMNQMRRGQAAALVYRHEEAMQLHAEEQALIMEICERRELEWQSGVQQHVERTQLGIEQELHLEEMRGRQSVLREELARSKSVLAEGNLEVESRPASRYADTPPSVVPRPEEGGSPPQENRKRGLPEGTDCATTRDDTILPQKPVSSPVYPASPSPASSSDMFSAKDRSPESSSSFEELKESVASCSTTSEIEEEPPADHPLEESVASCSTTSEIEEEPPVDHPIKKSVPSCATTSEIEEKLPTNPTSIKARPKTATRKETQHALESGMEKSGRGEDVGGQKNKTDRRPVTSKRRSMSACVAEKNSVRPRSTSQLCRSKLSSNKDAGSETPTKVLPTNKTNVTKCGGDRPGSTCKGERKVPQSKPNTKSVKFATAKPSGPSKHYISEDIPSSRNANARCTRPDTPMPRGTKYNADRPSTSKQERKVPQSIPDTKSVEFASAKPSGPSKHSVSKSIQSSRKTKATSTRPDTPMPRGLATDVNGTPRPAFTKSPLASNPRSAWSTVAKVPRPGTPIPGPGNPMPPAHRPIIKKSPLAAETKPPISTTTKSRSPTTLVRETVTTQSPSPTTIGGETVTTQSPVSSEESTGSVGSKRGRKPGKSPSSARARAPKPARSKSPITVNDKRGHRGTKVRQNTGKVRPKTAGTKSSLKRSSSPTQSGDSASNDGVGGDKGDAGLGETQKQIAKKKPTKAVSFSQTPDVIYISEQVYLTVASLDSVDNNTEADYSDDFESESEDSGDF